MTSKQRRAVDAVESDLSLTRARAGFLITYTADKIIGESIRIHGHFEEENIDHALKWIRALGHRVQLETFVDVGANIGTQTLWALRSGFECAICIEADLANFKLLRANQILNSVEDRCWNVLAAASHENGAGLLELSPSNFGDHRLRRLGERGLIDTYGEGQRPVRTIATKRLESIIEHVGTKIESIGLVWIDVQGSEGHVLAGAPALISSRVPMVVEFWPYGLERSGGYELFRSALFNGGRQVYDLRESVTQQSAQRVDAMHLDELFASWLGRESASSAQFTDLLVI